MRTEGIEAGPHQELSSFDLVPQMQAIRRPGQPADMANVVSFLASEEAAFMAAQVLINDGGWVRP